MNLPSITLMFSILALVAVAQGQVKCLDQSLIVDGEDCCSVIPAGATEAACFINGGATQCRCARQNNSCDTTGWSCVSVPSPTPVTVLDPTTDVIPVTTPTASPATTIVLNPTDATAIPVTTTIPDSTPTDSAEPTETPNSVPIIDTIAPTTSVAPPTTDEPVEPVENCTGQVCDVEAADACSCRPGLICRSRSTGSGLESRCSAKPRLGRTRISDGRGGAGGGAGGAGPRGNTRTTRIPPFLRRV
jgi:hypothetical protein